MVFPFCELLNIGNGALVYTWEWITWVVSLLALHCQEAQTESATAANVRVDDFIHVLHRCKLTSWSEYFPGVWMKRTIDYAVSRWQKRTLFPIVHRLMIVRNHLSYCSAVIICCCLWRRVERGENYCWVSVALLLWFVWKAIEFVRGNKCEHSMRSWNMTVDFKLQQNDRDWVVDDPFLRLSSFDVSFDLWYEF